MKCLSSCVLRPRWWWCGVDVRRWWQPCFDDDRWGRRQIIAAVSNSLFPSPSLVLLPSDLFLAPPICLLRLTLHFHPLHLFISRYIFIHLYTFPLPQKSTPFPSTCLSCRLLFSLPPSVWFPEGKGRQFLSTLRQRADEGRGWCGH